MNGRVIKTELTKKKISDIVLVINDLIANSLPSLEGHTGKFLKVNETGDGIEFVESSGYDGNPQIINQDPDHRLVTDVQTGVWDAKQPAGNYSVAGHTHDYAASNHNHDGTYSLANHTHNYEPANANIQSHIGTTHAPANAQKNSDITKAEIEAKFTGEISSHFHAGGVDPFHAKLRQTIDVTNATITPSVLTGLSFSYLANSFYIFDMYMGATSAAATTGYSFTLDVSTAVTTLGLTFNHQLATAGTITGGDSIADNARRGLSSGVPAITVINPIMGRGYLWTGANAGTAQFMFSPEVAASATCKAGSIITVMKIS